MTKRSEDTETLKKEIELLRQQTQKQAEDIQKKEEEIQKKEEEIQKKEEENKLLKSFLFSNKEKPIALQIVDYKDYDFESVIGEGGTSSVKIVTKKEKYAQKELKEITFEQVKRILSECEILIKLRHPCIVRVFGFSQGDDTHPPSIILSLESTSLEKSIQSKELNEEEKNRITVEVVLGMRYIHKKKFMHRDLKPSNILLSKNKHVRISDFGLAKEESLEMSQSKGVGTMRFMAPELFEEKDDEDEDKNKSETRYTNKVDVYSFGITLIYIVTGKYPTSSFKNVVNEVLPKLKG